MKSILPTALAVSLSAALLPAQFGRFGVVQTLSNQEASNELVTFLELPFFGFVRLPDTDTGGVGLPGFLGSQGPLIEARGGRFLIAVNPGSDNVTVFRSFFGIFSRAVELEASRGQQPVSVTARGRLVFVLNAGSDNIAGFRLSPRGDLVPIPGATAPLSQDGTAAAQIQFTPDGSALVVSERATNLLTIFPVGRLGQIGTPVQVASPGDTPFGFEFARGGTLVVSEANPSTETGSSVSSYNPVSGSGASVVTAQLGTQQGQACWVAVSRNGRFAYTGNTPTQTISGFAVGRDGSLVALDADGVTGSTVGIGGPRDLAVGRSGSLYALLSNGGQIAEFGVRRDGSLSEPEFFGSLPIGTAGLLAR